MAKLQKKRMELLTQMDKRRKARLPLDNVRGEFFKVFFFKKSKNFNFPGRFGMTTVKPTKLISSSGRKMLTNMGTFCLLRVIKENNFVCGYVGSNDSVRQSKTVLKYNY